MSDSTEVRRLIEHVRSVHRPSQLYKAEDADRWCCIEQDDWPCDSIKLADALEAALESVQLRQVSTVEELDELPVGTVVRDDEWEIAEKRAGMRDRKFWQFVGKASEDFPLLPAAVLFTPVSVKGESK